MLLLNLINTKLMEPQINEILKTNEESQKYGLMLTVKEVKEIIEVRNQVLQSYGRVELGIDVIKKLIQNFYTSSFISQENYESTINELQEIFYFMKNETEDKIGDDELVYMIKDFYNSYCEGSIELLWMKIEECTRDFRRKNQETDYLPKREG